MSDTKTIILENVFTPEYDSYKIYPFAEPPIVVPYNKGENK